MYINIRYRLLSQWGGCITHTISVFRPVEGCILLTPRIHHCLYMYIYLHTYLYHVSLYVCVSVSKYIYYHIMNNFALSFYCHCSKCMCECKCMPMYVWWMLVFIGMCVLLHTITNFCMRVHNFQTFRHLLGLVFHAI